MPQDQPKRQAVVIIHGIGEQRPMDTAYSFVEAVLGGGDPDSTFFSKPDAMSEQLELRRLQSRGRYATDFYEYYWAHEVQGTKFVHLVQWLRSLLFRLPSRVPRPMRITWSLAWILALGFVSFLLLGIGDKLIDGALGGLGQLAVLLSAVAAVLEYFLLETLGDAARYLSPHPRNIAIRRKIRAEGVKLLKRLHSSGRYNRIVVAGHSLGSVIAYDLVRRVWADRHARHDAPQRLKQEALAAVESAADALPPRPSPKQIAEFQDRQRDLWIEQRRLGVPWLITDLVTLGSPLAHGALLLASSPDDLDQRIARRELPSCPPCPEGESGFSFRLPRPYEVDGEKTSLRALHHAAPFACTRWTNIYFPLRFGLFGDLVGGPIAGVFGRGVRDVPVATDRGFGLARWIMPICHTGYWKPDLAETPIGGTGRPVPTLRDALGLREVARWYPEP